MNRPGIGPWKSREQTKTESGIELGCLRSPRWLSRRGYRRRPLDDKADPGILPDRFAEDRNGLLSRPIVDRRSFLEIHRETKRLLLRWSFFHRFAPSGYLLLAGS